MAETVYTRLDGSHPTGSDVNFGDRLFNGSASINPFLRMAAGTVPYAGPVYAGGQLVNSFLHFLGRQGLFGKPNGPSSSEGFTPAETTSEGFTPARQLEQPSGGGRPPVGYVPFMNNTTYNSWRGANSPAYQQRATPGSAIGPSNPTMGARPPGRQPGQAGYLGNLALMGRSGDMGAAASAYQSWVKSRNQI